MSSIRHSERRETLAYWPAADEQTGDSVGLVTNLSEEGISIHSSSPFVPGQQLNIRVSVDSQQADARHLHLHVEAIWCHPSELKGLYHSGFKLIRSSEETLQKIRHLLDTYSFHAPRYVTPSLLQNPAGVFAREKSECKCQE